MKNSVMSMERLTLREMNKNDVGNLMKIFSDLEAMRYYPSTKDKRQTMEWIEWTLDNYNQYGVGLWVVEDKVAGVILEQSGIVTQEDDDEIAMEIGYLFARSAWSK